MRKNYSKIFLNGESPISETEIDPDYSSKWGALSLLFSSKPDKSVIGISDLH